METLVAVAARTAIVLVAIVAGMRLFGRRRTGEARLDDILMVLLVANSVQNAMTTGSGKLVIALASAGTLILVDRVLGIASPRSRRLERAISGTPTVLVHDGRIVSDNLRREQLTEQDLLVAARKFGVTTLADVKLGLLEPNGSISIVTRAGD